MAIALSHEQQDCPRIQQVSTRTIVRRMRNLSTVASYLQLGVHDLAQQVLLEREQNRTFVNHRLGHACALMIKRLVNGTLVATKGKRSGIRGAYTDEDVVIIDNYAERYVRMKGL
jgi:hypothetical protein